MSKDARIWARVDTRTRDQLDELVAELNLASRAEAIELMTRTLVELTAKARAKPRKPPRVVIAPRVGETFTLSATYETT